MAKHTTTVLFGVVALLLLSLGALGFYAYQLQARLSQQDSTQTARDDTRAESFARAPISKDLSRLFDAQIFDNQSDPFAELHQLQSEMNKAFGSTLSRFQNDPYFSEVFKDSGFSPKVNLIEQEGEYIVSVEIAGGHASEIQVNAEGQLIHIEAKTRSETETNDPHSAMLHQERFFGSFKRSIQLPADANTEQMSQEYENGVLKIRIPKREYRGVS